MSGESSADVASVLSADAADHARSVATYANAAPSRRALRHGRLLSSNGYLDSVTFGFVASNSALVSRGENRACTTIRLFPYGAREDVALLTRTDAEGRSAVGPVAGLIGFVGSRRLTQDDKTASLVRRVLGTTGPTYHVIVSRSGGVLVAASLDDVTDPRAPLAIDVAYESALIAYESEWASGPPGSFVELKMTAAQADSLVVTLAKIYAAYPAVSREPSVVLADTLPAEWLDFAGMDWQEGPVRNTPVEAAAVVGPFDVATEVFERVGSEVPRTGRTTAASAIMRADTMGQRSELLGDYARLAGMDRARAMQAVSRREFYVQRVVSAQAQANDAGEAAASAAASAPSGPRTVTHAGPWTYDFTTGRWQDDNQSTY